VSPITVNSSVVPSGHADPERQLYSGLGTERGHDPLQLEPGRHGPVRIVLPHPFGPPHRHQRVADVLVDAAAVGGDHGVEPGPELVHGVGDELGVEALRHRREPTHIGEQHADLAAARLGSAEGREAVAERGDGDINDLVGHRAAQLLLRGDRQFQLIPICHTPSTRAESVA
jgi:hypothetical protein